MRSTTLSLVFLLVATLGGSARAGEFVIDSRGSRPSKFRITARCRNVDTWFDPSIYKSGLMDRTGKDIKESPGMDLHLALRDGHVLLLEQTGWQSEEYWVLGEAADLDRMTLADGVEIRGHTQWDTGSLAWRVRSNAEQVPGLEKYKGPLLDGAWARDRLLAALVGEAQESESNREVLATVLTHYWWTLIDANDDDHEPEHFLALARAFYMEPFSGAFERADAAGRKRLATLNAEVLEGAREVLKQWVEDTWRPETYRRTMQVVVSELEALGR